jgi:hypothetical protein
MFENPTVSAEGTAITPINMNRFSSNTPTGDIKHTPTVTGTGTSFGKELIPGGTGPFSIGGIDGRSVRAPEIILHSARTYLIRITNQSGGTIDISFAAGFYESPGG